MVCPTCISNILVILSNVLLLSYGKELKTWFVHNHCGNIISYYETAGALRLEAAHLPTTKDRYEECKVVVSPSRLPGSGKYLKVLYYFTEFNLPGPCSVFTVTVTGSSSQTGPYVKGKQRTLCYSDTNLTEPETVFTTLAGSFDVTILWKKKKNVDWHSAGFVLKFASFYDGPCEKSEEVVECANKRCTASVFHCHRDVSTCGSAEERVCREDEDKKESGTLGSGLEAIGNFAKIIGGIVVPLILISIIVAVGRKVYTDRKSQENTRTRSPSLNTEERQARELSRLNITDEEVHRNTNSPDSGVSTGQTAPPSYDTVTPWSSTEPSELPYELPSAPPSVTPSAPPCEPPSQQQAAPPPSYGDYILNESLYKR